MNNIIEGSSLEPNGELYSLFDDLNKSTNNLLDILIDYTTKLSNSKFSSNLSSNKINNIFNYSLNLASEREDENSALIIFKNQIQYTFNNYENPFLMEAIKLPAILINNIKARKIHKTITQYWNSSFSDNKDYLNLLENAPESNKKELLKFLLNEKYQIKINPQNFSTNSESLQVLQLYFNQLYYEGYSDQAIDLLKIFPKSWKTCWNKHLCNNFDNENISELISFLKNEKHLLENQNILLLQVSLKGLLNYIETGFEDYSNIDEKLINKVSIEVEAELSKYKSFDDDQAIDLFSKKLYKNVIFDKAVKYFNSVPKKTSREHRVALYIDFKQIFEECIENDIKDAGSYLETINKVLFEELKDKTSGANLIIQMLKNKKQVGLAQYVKQLSYILDPYCIEMESLFESLIIFFSKTNIQKRQITIYSNLFNELDAAQFKILNELIITVHKDEKNISKFAKTVCDNLDIFKLHSQTFYILMDSILNKKFQLSTHQTFIAILLSSKMNNTLSRNFLYLLVDHFFEQPYRDFKKDFPHRTLNFDLMEQLIVMLDQTKVAYMRDKETFVDLEDKKFAIKKTKDFLTFLLNKTHVKKTSRN